MLHGPCEPVISWGRFCLCILASAGFALIPIASAQEGVVDEVLKQIEKENHSVHSTSSTVERTLDTNDFNKKIFPSIHYFYPKDHFPRDLTGLLLIGDFVVMGEYEDGGMEICAIEDSNSMFPRAVRSFIIRNMTSGLSPNNYYDGDKQPKISFTKRKPLKFLGKLHPARYSVEALK